MKTKMFKVKPYRFIRLSNLLILNLVMLATACFKNPELASLHMEVLEATQDQVAFITVIESDGGSDILQKGICWNNMPNATLKDMYSVDGFGTGEYVTILGLFNDGTTLYFRPYALNSAGISYGNEISFSLISFRIDFYGNITNNSADFRCEIITESEILSKGICWNKAGNPTILNNHTQEGPGSGVFTSQLENLEASTTYYARPYATNANGTFYGETVAFTTYGIPVVRTMEIQDAGTFIPFSGGIILDNAGSLIEKGGICWSSGPMPTVDDEKSEGYVYYDSFYRNLVNLKPGFTYFVRAYVVSTFGISYGEPVELIMPQAVVIDVDGNPYSSVNIGSQEWLVENLRSSRFSNGDIIPQLANQAEWFDANGPAWGYYANDESMEIPYGKLYNWPAITDTRNICPSGWHPPSYSDFDELINSLGGMEAAGIHMLEQGTAHWSTANNPASNSSGFTALPAGGISGAYEGEFVPGSNGVFWTTTETDDSKAVCYNLFPWNEMIMQLEWNKKYGFSIRCLKD